MNNELKEIKKIYGEEMMHMCRDLFPSILEVEGKLLSILKANIAPTHSFASDIKEFKLYSEFKDWIYDLAKEDEIKHLETDKTPFELMEEAGYTLYECHTEDDIQKFKKYYAKREALCTFNGGRLERCHVFFAVKKNVDEIKREDFPNPEREDEYGTSVISLQFDRGGMNMLSIKNRYNHTVDNPDATFSNNLENIIPGLTYSFKKHYGFNMQKQNLKSGFLFRQLDYVQGSDLRVYRFNIERGAIYYCENNIIVGENYEVNYEYANNKERYILLDDYLLDLKEKQIIELSQHPFNSFCDSIYEVGKIKKIDVVKNGENRIIRINYEDDKKVEIEINNNNSIVRYDNKYVEKIGDNFLRANENVKSINLPNVKIIGDNVLFMADSLSDINLPEVQIIGSYFLYNDMNIPSLSLPKVTEIGDGLLNSSSTTHIKDFYAPNLKKIGCGFLMTGDITDLDLPNVIEVGDSFAVDLNKLVSVNMPKLKRAGHHFLNWNKSLTRISLPELRSVGSSFLISNEIIRFVNLPKLKNINGFGFLHYNKTLKELSLPELTVIPGDFLGQNTKLEKVFLPKAVVIDDGFLKCNRVMTAISLPMVKKIGNSFMSRNETLQKIDIPMVETIGNNFLSYNRDMKSITIPNVQVIDYEFMLFNENLKKINLPSVKLIASHFLYNNKEIVEIELPNLEYLGPHFLSNDLKLKRIYVPKMDQGVIYQYPELSDAFVFAEKHQK